MVASILRSCNNDLQTFSHVMDDKKKMQDRIFRQFVDSLIRENATHKGDYFSLFVCDLSHGERKLFLSYLVDQETFIDLTSNPYREMEALKEYEPEMQYFINERIDDVYHEDMREMHEGLDACQMSLT